MKDELIGLEADLFDSNLESQMQKQRHSEGKCSGRASDCFHCALEAGNFTVKEDE